MKAFFGHVVALSCLFGHSVLASSVPTSGDALYGIAQNHSAATTDFLRIVGGKPAKLGQFPHQASYQVYDKIPGTGISKWWHMCGGSIVTPTIIITAAHCLEAHDLDVSKTRVNVGVLDFRDWTTGQVLAIKRAEHHPDYHRNMNDIAFLELMEPIKFNENVQPIKIARPGDQPSKNPRACTASGWGNSFFGGPTSTYLNYVKLDYIEDLTCQKMWLVSLVLIRPEQHICAGTAAGGEGVCQGDSGGPLICQVEDGATDEYVLFGATSFGSRTCANKKEPAVWAEIPHFLDWIQEASGATLPGLGG